MKTECRGRFYNGIDNWSDLHSCKVNDRNLKLYRKRKLKYEGKGAGDTLYHPHTFQIIKRTITEEVVV